MQVGAQKSEMVWAHCAGSAPNCFRGVNRRDGGVSADSIKKFCFIVDTTLVMCSDLCYYLNIKT
jgi:hypothetical protein